MGNNLKVHTASDFQAFSYTQEYFLRVFKKVQTVAASLGRFCAKSLTEHQKEVLSGRDQRSPCPALCSNAGYYPVCKPQIEPSAPHFLLFVYHLKYQGPCCTTFLIAENIQKYDTCKETQTSQKTEISKGHLKDPSASPLPIPGTAYQRDSEGLCPQRLVRVYYSFKMLSSKFSSHVQQLRIIQKTDIWKNRLPLFRQLDYK